MAFGGERWADGGEAAVAVGTGAVSGERGAGRGFWPPTKEARGPGRGEWGVQWRGRGGLMTLPGRRCGSCWTSGGCRNLKEALQWGN